MTLAAAEAPTDGADGSCAGPDDLMGSPIGITSAGDTIVSSRIEVARECFHAIEVADQWPSVEECKVIVDN